tara:strand:+ start:1315 stop:1491 length:177 start_codon:yes stop_codon:yes gene_type:complete
MDNKNSNDRDFAAWQKASAKRNREASRDFDAHVKAERIKRDADNKAWVAANWSGWGEC